MQQESNETDALEDEQRATMSQAAFHSDNQRPDLNAGVDQSDFRRAMGHFSTGITVVTVETPSGVHGMTANAVTSLSLNPPLLIVCIGLQARLRRYITETERFAVNILAEDQEPLARYFARAWGPDEPPPEHEIQNWSSVPRLGGSLASVACDLVETHVGGDHIIAIGHATDTCGGDSNGRPLLYYQGKYASIAPFWGLNEPDNQ